MDENRIVDGSCQEQMKKNDGDGKKGWGEVKREKEAAGAGGFILTLSLYTRCTGRIYGIRIIAGLQQQSRSDLVRGVSFGSAPFFFLENNVHLAWLRYLSGVVLTKIQLRKKILRKFILPLLRNF